jgi:hypothetical protein
MTLIPAAVAAELEVKLIDAYRAGATWFFVEYVLPLLAVQRALAAHGQVGASRPITDALRLPWPSRDGVEFPFGEAGLAIDMLPEELRPIYDPERFEDVLRPHLA